MNYTVSVSEFAEKAELSETTVRKYIQQDKIDAKEVENNNDNSQKKK